MEKLNEVVFYTIDKAIRSYRVFAQKQLRANGFNITIDQWLIIKCIMENPDISQQELGEMVFKDNASVTRIIELLVKGKYLIREAHQTDKRRFTLVVTKECKGMINKMQKVVLDYREAALKDIDVKDIKQVTTVLESIIKNCK